MPYRKQIHSAVLAFVMLFFFAMSAAAGKNVILIIPDGCSASMWAAVRAMTAGTGNLTNVDRLPVQGRCQTCSADATVTDSAAAATALACGVKTNNGVLGMNAATVFGDSLSGKPLPGILELAGKAGYATGLVTTAYIQHATPAAFYAHRAHRDWYDLIAGDLPSSGIDVLMGGGRQYMIPAGTVDEEGAASKRADSRNVLAEMRAKGYTYISNENALLALDSRNTRKMIGLFNPGHMEYELHRAENRPTEPPLWEMEAKALEILSKNEKGFFLMVEAARIDMAAHKHLTQEYLWEGIACDKTVGVAMEFARKHRDTLLIVVPDHGTGGQYLTGLSTADGGVIDKGFAHYRHGTNGFPAGNGGAPVAIQWIEHTQHTGEDVTVSARGPHARELDGVVRNTDIFRVMYRQLGIGKTSDPVIDY